MFLSILKWIVVGLLLPQGTYLCFFTTGRNFLGLLCFGIAALIVCYHLLGLLRKSHANASKALRVVLNSFLIMGLIAYAITLTPIIHASRGTEEAECQYLVVLGAKVNGESPSFSLRDRLDKACDYLTEHPDTIVIVSGGQGADEGISEAQCMYNELTKMGIDGNRIWMEDQSTSTRENLNFSLALIEEKTGTRPDSIGLLSSEYHIYRACMVAEECGVTATGIPAPTRWFSLKLNYFLREVAALWYYLVF